MQRLLRSPVLPPRGLDLGLLPLREHVLLAQRRRRHGVLLLEQGLVLLAHLAPLRQLVELPLPPRPHPWSLVSTLQTERKCGSGDDDKGPLLAPRPRAPPRDSFLFCRAPSAAPPRAAIVLPLNTHFTSIPLCLYKLSLPV